MWQRLRSADPAELLARQRRILALLWQASPRWTLISSLLMGLEILLGIGLLYLLKRLVDVITLSLAEGEGMQLVPVLLFVGLTAACSVGFMGARALARVAREAQSMEVADHVDGRIHAQAVGLDFSFYESPRYFDTLQRARMAGGARPAQVVTNLMQLGRGLLMLGAITVLMATISWVLLPILLVAVLPALLVRLLFTRELHQWQRRRTQLERRSGYLDTLLTSDFHAKELRLNQLGRFLIEQFRAIRQQIRSEQMRIIQRSSRNEFLVGGFASLVFFLALGVLAWQTAEGANSVGDLVLFLLILQRAQSTGQELVSQASRLYEDHLYMGMLFEFFDVRPRVAEPEAPLALPERPRQGFRVEHLHFAYPNTEREVLRDINLEIRPGQIIALVGGNGSGKTSLIKLLCRLYDPDGGRILLDGTDIRHFESEAYRRQLSVIFQDYGRYADTVRENIRFGDVSSPRDTPLVAEAAEKAGAMEFIQALPRGLDTRLSRMFDDGVDISVGQWQRIALARAFMHRSNLVILDEPTSSMDPGAEFALFENFRERIGERSALIISHRLSTVRMADYIYVLDDGEIREQGTHDELMARAGHYAKLFSMQAYHYR